MMPTDEAATSHNLFVTLSGWQNPHIYLSHWADNQWCMMRVRAKFVTVLANIFLDPAMFVLIFPSHPTTVFPLGSSEKTDYLCCCSWTAETHHYLQSKTMASCQTNKKQPDIREVHMKRQPDSLWEDPKRTAVDRSIRMAKGRDKGTCERKGRLLLSFEKSGGNIDKYLITTKW